MNKSTFKIIVTGASIALIAILAGVVVQHAEFLFSIFDFGDNSNAQSVITGLDDIDRGIKQSLQFNEHLRDSIARSEERARELRETQQQLADTSERLRNTSNELRESSNNIGNTSRDIEQSIDTIGSGIDNLGRTTEEFRTILDGIARRNGINTEEL